MYYTILVNYNMRDDSEVIGHTSVSATLQPKSEWKGNKFSEILKLFVDKTIKSGKDNALKQGVDCVLEVASVNIIPQNF